MTMSSLAAFFLHRRFFKNGFRLLGRGIIVETRGGGTGAQATAYRQASPRAQNPSKLPSRDLT